MINSFQADVIGLAGSALFIGAFAYANLTRTLNKIAFNLANLLGSALLLISLSVNFNLAAFVLETAWGLIAAAGLAMGIWNARKQAAGASPTPPPGDMGGR